jgi:hypothetical protein
LTDDLFPAHAYGVTFFSPYYGKNLTWCALLGVPLLR